MGALRIYLFLDMLRLFLLCHWEKTKPKKDNFLLGSALEANQSTVDFANGISWKYDEREEGKPHSVTRVII